MPASANCPERTLIIPILTVPCACADETPVTSARAQPSHRCVRCIAILPGVFRLCWQNCTHENLRGRESFGVATLGADPPSGMHAAFDEARPYGPRERVGRSRGGFPDCAGGSKPLK